jgi:hypothetical protein
MDRSLVCVSVGGGEAGLPGMRLVFLGRGRSHRGDRPDLWVPKTCVTWADALHSAVPRPAPGEPVLARPDVR